MFGDIDRTLEVAAESGLIRYGSHTNIDLNCGHTAIN